MGPNTLTDQLAQLDRLLEQIEQLAARLRSDPDRYVSRTASELHAAFDDRRAIEPLFGRLRDSVRMLRRANHDGTRREFRLCAPTLDELDTVVERDVKPRLRQIGFEV